MNENSVSKAVVFQLPEKGITTIGDRFGGFAMAHLTLSILMVSFSPFELAIVDSLPEWFWQFVPVAMMGIYFPLGILTSSMGEWSFPQNFREKLLAVILPTAIAWMWVGIVLWSVSLGGDSARNVLPMIFFISVIFAAPSSIFVLFYWSLSFSQLFWGGLMAGILPPLLFALGSFWWSGQQVRKEGLGRKISEEKKSST